MMFLTDHEGLTAMLIGGVFPFFFLFFESQLLKLQIASVKCQ
jgi:hypothetical protein